MIYNLYNTVETSLDDFWKLVVARYNSLVYLLVSKVALTRKSFTRIRMSTENVSISNNCCLRYFVSNMLSAPEQDTTIPPGTESPHTEHVVENEYQDDDYVSLDEEDEELIWRVFFQKLEKHNKKSNNNDSELDESEESEDTSEEEEEETGDEDFDEDDLSDLSDIDDPALVATYKALMSEKVNKNLGEEEQRRLLISNFTDDQMERFEAYRRMTVNKPGVKKICNGIVGHTIPQIIAVVMAGVSKLFLGEIISKAFEIQERNSKGRLLMDIETKKKQKREIISSLQRGEEIEVDERALKFEGDEIHPLQPEHIREAWRLYQRENSVFSGSRKRKMGDDGPFYV